MKLLFFTVFQNACCFEILKVENLVPKIPYYVTRDLNNDMMR